MRAGGTRFGIEANDSEVPHKFQTRGTHTSPLPAAKTTASNPEKEVGFQQNKSLQAVLEGQFQRQRTTVRWLI